MCKSKIHAEDIARCALNHYNNKLPGKKGKAKDGQEWTVYSAIVASRPSKKDTRDYKSQLWVVSCATGSKCCPARNKCTKTNLEGGINLHDSHAEVLARRGLMRVLWTEIESQLEMKLPSHSNEPKNSVSSNRLLVERSYSKNNGTITFELKEDISLHLYISDSPCGDASIYSLQSSAQNNTQNGKNHHLLFTGAKLVMNDANKAALDQAGGGSLLPCCTQNKEVSNETNTTAFVARENVQVLGALRTKSGRSNLPNHLRSTSMSCSDKICRWCVLGLQGSLVRLVFISFWS